MASTLNDVFFHGRWWISDRDYEGSRITAPTWDDVEEQCGDVHEWGDDGIPDEPFLVDRRRAMSLTDWEREVVKIADRYGLVYERPSSGRNHGKLRDPITNRFRPVSCSPKEMGKAAIHVTNDARHLVAERPVEPSTNGHVDEPVSGETAVDVSAPVVTDPPTAQSDPVAPAPPVVPVPAPAVRSRTIKVRTTPKRPIKTRTHDDKLKRQLLVELREKVSEIDELEVWQRERRVEADELIARGRKMGLSMPVLAEAAGRSTPWVQTCLRRVAGVGSNKPYGKGA